MKAIPLLILMLVSLGLAARAQSPEQIPAELPSSPVVWERYNIDKQQISFLFPKLPTVIVGTTSCTEVDRRTYHSYTEGAIYGIKVVAKIKSSPPSCTRVERFTPDLFTDQITKFRTEMGESSPASPDKGGHSVYKFSKPGLDLYVYDDMEHKRWVEVSINHRNDAKLNEDFLDSLAFQSKEGKDVGDGAEVTLGDPTFQTGTIPPGTEPSKAVDDPIMIIAKPKASYTNAARQAREQGSVRLRVTLLANGSVGSITPVTTLKYGLTEQAIAAAKKIVFLPKRVSGVPVSAVVTFEYGFNIY